MKKITALLHTFRPILSYLFFGVCTTGINMIIYHLCYNIAAIPNVASTIMAWVAAVAFAYITNKLFVFNSRSRSKQVLLREITSFVSCRLLTGVLDVAVMFVSVSLLSMNATLWKLISNLLVTILNFIASKLVIFKNK